jgi:hypothetical protein
LVAVCFTGSALASTPAVAAGSADQARAEAALLRQSDFGAGWTGGETPTSSPVQRSCPDSELAQSAAAVRGHADARFSFSQGGVVIAEDVEVLASPAALRRDFARTINGKLLACLTNQLDGSSGVVRAAVTRIPFPPTGVVSAAFRATVVVHNRSLQGAFVSDFVYFGTGRTEYSLNVVAPLGMRAELGRFELAVAEILLRRAASSQSQA